jgi:hypothetical protein
VNPFDNIGKSKPSWKHRLKNRENPYQLRDEDQQNKKDTFFHGAWMVCVHVFKHMYPLPPKSWIYI